MQGHQRLKQTMRMLGALLGVALLGGCAVPSLRIRLQDVPPPSPGMIVEVIDARAEADKVIHADPKLRSNNHIYIGDKDTLPARMDVLRARLAADERVRRLGQPVTVERFDILWDTSGTASGFTLALDGKKPLDMLGTKRIGNGVNDFTCTLLARLGERSARQLVVRDYVAGEISGAFSPETGAAADRCVQDVISAWIDEVTAKGSPRR